GVVAFQVGLTGGTSGSGLFIGTPGSVQAIALQGTAAPGGGGNYSFLTNSRRLVLNASGQVAYYAELTGGASTTGTLVGTPGPIQAVALQRTPAPAGGNYSFLGVPSLNNAGQVAFASFLTGGPSTQGIFAGTVGSIQAVALQGAAAPAGGNYSTLNS